MPVSVLSAALVGIDAAPVEVEADVSRGLPNVVIVGLPDASVKESKERIRTALRNADLPFPRTRITVNLAPADLRKEGPSYDLPIAVAMLAASGALPLPKDGVRRFFLGELGLDGSVRSVRGALASAMMAGFGAELFVPAANADEAAMAGAATVYPVRTVAELCAHLEGSRRISAHAGSAPTCATPACTDFADIVGQEHAKRAMEIAAAGGHNVLLSGPPGSGKTLLARALPGILPPMTRDEALEVTKVASASAVTGRIAAARPFRSPHHTASGMALVGGGAMPQPGEVTLAHGGVLFLDELPEFSRAALENLRQPLEDGVVTVARTGGTLRFPARCMLVAARNPCPCGYATDPSGQCSCPPARVLQYGRKISGPLLDRIDLHVDMPRVAVTQLLRDTRAEASATVRERVMRARAVQRARFAGAAVCTNGELRDAALREHCALDAGAATLLRASAERIGLSARAVTRVTRVARTIADLAGERRIGSVHLAEALHYRERR